MPRFGKASERRLSTVHPDLQLVMRVAIRYFDFTVIYGFRTEKAQARAYKAGRSKAEWPKSKHNKRPSSGIDIAPWPVQWEDTESFVYLAGFIMAIAQNLGIAIRWGGDWDSDRQVFDERFRDYGHFELAD